MPGIGEGPAHLRAQAIGQRCGRLHHCLLPRQRASCALREVLKQPLPQAAHKTSSGSTVARLFEGQLGKEPQTFLFQNRILACPLVKFLLSAHFHCFFKRKTKGKSVYSSTWNQSAASQKLPGMAQGCTVVHPSVLSPGAEESSKPPTTPPHAACQLSPCHWPKSSSADIGNEG